MQVTLGIVLLGMAAHVWKERKKERRRAVSDLGDLTPRGWARAKRKMLVRKHLNTTFKAGMWSSAHLTLFVLDLSYPAVPVVIPQRTFLD